MADIKAMTAGEALQEKLNRRNMDIERQAVRLIEYLIEVPNKTLTEVINTLPGEPKMTDFRAYNFYAEVATKLRTLGYTAELKLMRNEHGTSFLNSKQFSTSLVLEYGFKEEDFHD